MVKTITTCVTPDDAAFIDCHRLDVAKLIRSTILGMRLVGIYKLDNYDLLLKETAGILRKTESSTLAEAIATLQLNGHRGAK